MRHIKYIGITIAFILGIFIAVGQGGFALLKPLIVRSEFRLAVANNAEKVAQDKNNVLLLVGNSRIMGGIDTTLFRMSGEYDAAYNLAYNGLDFTDVHALISAFQQSCKCKLGKVIINAGALPQQIKSTANDLETVSDVKIFLAAFSESLSRDIHDIDHKLGVSLDAFPLLHFNNELFLRSAYYLVTGRSDQNYSNNYSFELTNGMIQRLKGKKLKAAVDKDALTLLRDKLDSGGVELAIIIPPLHPAFIKNVPNYNVYLDDINRMANMMGILFYDHSRLFIDNSSFFADPVHINKAGQAEYTKYLLDKVFIKSEASSY